jgi:hypothetical protein
MCLRTFIRDPLNTPTAETVHALATKTSHYGGSASDGFDLCQVNIVMCLSVPPPTGPAFVDGVVPAEAGTQRRSYKRRWIPASAGMTL